MCESRREPGAEREPRGNRRLSVVRAVHEPPRSESEGEPSGGAAIFIPKPKLAPPRTRDRTLEGKPTRKAKSSR